MYVRLKRLAQERLAALERQSTSHQDRKPWSGKPRKSSPKPD
jgi:hypothetical protein